MKKLLLLFAISIFFSCSNDDPTVVEEEVNLIINHYKVPAEFTLANDFLVQEVGENFFRSVPSIMNFEPIPGFVYEIQATKTITTNQDSDISVFTYRMNEIISEAQAGVNDSFTIPLTRYNARTQRVDSWITGNAQDGYLLSGEIPIVCNGNCTRFNTAHIYQEAFSGRFIHGENGEYILLEVF